MLCFKGMFHLENRSIQDGSFVVIVSQCDSIINKWHNRLIAGTIILLFCSIKQP